jgi:hypothetical protein
MARIFFRNSGHVNDAPRTPVTEHMARQQAQEPAEIKAVRLGSARPSIDFDARRVDHIIRDPVRRQVTMQPEAIAPRFVTAGHRGVRRQPEPLLRSFNLPHQRMDAACRNLPHARPLAQTDGQSQFPAALTQFEGQQQATAYGSRLTRTGHGDHRYAPPLKPHG